jgi:hypothetical protein
VVKKEVLTENKIKALSLLCSGALGGSISDWKSRLLNWLSLDSGSIVYSSDNRVVAFIGLIKDPFSNLIFTSSIVNEISGTDSLIFLRDLVTVCRSADRANTANQKASMIISRCFSYSEKRNIIVPFVFKPYSLERYNCIKQFINPNFIIRDKGKVVYVIRRKKYFFEIIAVFSSLDNVYLIPFYNFHLLFTRYQRVRGIFLISNGFKYFNKNEYSYGEELF